MTKKIIRKVFVNKRNKQLTISIPKKELKRVNPEVKFNKIMFVQIKVVKEPKLRVKKHGNN